MSLTRRAPEKAVEADVDRALLRMGFDVTRLSQPRASGLTLGLPDRYASHAAWGLRIWIEIKAGKNKPSAHQLAWHARERAAGGIVLVVWSVEDLVRELRALGAPIS